MNRNKKTHLFFLYLITQSVCFSLAAMDDDGISSASTPLTSSTNRSRRNTSFPHAAPTTLSQDDGFLKPLRDLLNTHLPGYSVSQGEADTGNNLEQWRTSLGQDSVNQFRFVSNGPAPHITAGEAVQNHLLPGLLAGVFATLGTSTFLNKIPGGRRLTRRWGLDPFLVAGAAGALATAWSTRTTLNTAWEAQFAAENAMEQIKKDFALLQSTAEKIAETTGFGGSNFVTDVLNQAGYDQNPYKDWNARAFAHELQATVSDVPTQQNIIALLKVDQEATLRLQKAFKDAQTAGFTIQFSNQKENNVSMLQTLEERFESTGLILGALGDPQVRPSQAQYNLERESLARAAQQEEGRIAQALGALPYLMQTAEKLAPFAAIAALLLQSQLQKQREPVRV